MERRSFLSGAAAAAATAATALVGKEAAFPSTAAAQTAQPQRLVTQVWSRHAQWVRTEAETRQDPYGTGVAIGEAMRAGGYAAVDLTVRDGGHVLPSQVATHLPQMLAGIRSTGTICDHIGTNFAPPTNAADTSWIQTQFVHEILSVAGANGIRKYRFNNSGGQSFANNTFGQTMTSLLDAVRLQYRRLAQINAMYGGIQGVAHTHGSNIGNTVEPYAYAMQGIDPRLIGINLAIGHVVSNAPGNAWQIMMRRWMPNIGCVAPEDVAGTINPTTGALSVGRVSPGMPGLINWTTFYQLLRLGGYSGAAENQLEYSITGGTGTSVSLNNADFADSPNYTSGRLTPAIMIAEFRKNSDSIRTRAIAAGWDPSQIL
ncbi:twin-arginine translocation signal domain-containing protein [Piscinibacter koreensis]|uniref:Twin-arginine translocation signal domain-containing protein n=1 Tax=Piscinibacter koreensis TaxID=2742824 RepID=A0A7Y6NMS2_9BURK|nr:twin-arginine translocation signal domain-containing protein [Schlegelella koreensis]NUZ06073.1 twin-arginine translocation signal domain-containing protein [Schlegelella koreensis]